MRKNPRSIEKIPEESTNINYPFPKHISGFGLHPPVLSARSAAFEARTKSS
jgi:hypothetical protein